MWLTLKFVVLRYELVECLSKKIRDAIINEQEPRVSEKCRRAVKVEKEEEVSLRIFFHVTQDEKCLVVLRTAMLWTILTNASKIHTLLGDTGFATIGELRTAMLDQSDWRERIHAVRASARPN